MTAHEVPVEELIGWRRDPHQRHHWLNPADTRNVYYLRAEVDDLGDWLMDRGRVEIICDKKNGKRLVTMYRPDRLPHVAELAPTIRAALEAAVRAVHEQENR